MILDEICIRPSVRRSVLLSVPSDISFVGSFVRSFVRWFVGSFVRSFVRSSVRLALNNQCPSVCCAFFCVVLSRYACGLDVNISWITKGTEALSTCLSRTNKIYIYEGTSAVAVRPLIFQPLL